MGTFFGVDSGTSDSYGVKTTFRLPDAVNFNAESSGPQGVRETLSGLDKIQTQMLEQVVAPSIAEGAEILANVMVSMVPVATGTLKAAIGTRMKTYKGSGVAWAGAGALRGIEVIIDGKKHKPAKYAHLADAGRKAIVAKDKKLKFTAKMGGTFFGASVGPATGAHFISKTESSAGPAAVAAVQAGIEQRLAALTK